MGQRTAETFITDIDNRHTSEAVGALALEQALLGFDDTEIIENDEEFIAAIDALNDIETSFDLSEPAMRAAEVAVAQTVQSTDLSWLKEGLCAQTYPDAFFPEKGGSTREAKAVCMSGCAVQERCLKHAVDNEERFGIWGGASERERRKIKKGIFVDLTLPSKAAYSTKKNNGLSPERYGEIIETAAKLDHDSEEFVALIEEYFGWTGGKLSSAQKIDAYKRVTSGERPSEIAKSMDCYTSQVSGPITAMKKRATPELQDILLGEQQGQQQSA